MLHVFVCEDNKAQRISITKCIENFIMIENLDMKLMLSTEDPYELILHVESNRASGLYFLDVALGKDINGIELAEKIRAYDPRGFIVFVTTHADMLQLTFKYKVEAMDYIIKDNLEGIGERICECIINAQKKYTSAATELQSNFVFKVYDQIVSIEYEKILYFETSPDVHKVTIHTTNRIFDFYAKISEVEKKLDSRFFRCHKSFVVNTERIISIDTKERKVFLECEASCFVSARKVRGLCQRVK